MFHCLMLGFLICCLSYFLYLILLFPHESQVSVTCVALPLVCMYMGIPTDAHPSLDIDTYLNYTYNYL